MSYTVPVPAAGPSAQPLANPVTVVSTQFLATYPVDLVITEKMMSLKEGTFTVSDVNGNLMFKIKGSLFSLHDRRVLVDGADTPIISFRQKILTAHRRWHVYRGESSEAKDLLFTAKKSSFFQLKTELDVFLAANTKEEQYDFKVKGSWGERSCTIYTGDNTIIAQGALIMVDFEEIPNDPEAPLDSSPERAIMVVPCGDRNVRKSIYIGVNRFLSADEQPSCSIPVYRMTRVTGSFIGSFQRWLLEDDSRVQFELRNLAALNFMTGTFDVMFYIWSETLLDGRRIARLGRPHQLLSEVLLESICLFKRRDNTVTKPENWYQDDNRVVRDSIRFHSDGGIQVRDEHFNLLGWIFYQSCANYDELSAQISFCARRGGLEEPYTTRFEADDDCVPTQDFTQFCAKLKWIKLYPTRDGDRNDDDVYVQADDENNAIRDEDGIVAIKMKWKKMRVKWKKMRVHWKKIRVMMTWKKLQMVQWVKTKMNKWKRRQMKKLNKMLSNGIAKGAD